MHCRRVQRFIFLFADGQVAGAVEVAFRSHVEICPQCARELEAAIRLRALLRQRCRRDCAPAHLRTRLLGLLAGRLASEAGEDDER